MTEEILNNASFKAEASGLPSDRQSHKSPEPANMLLSLSNKKDKNGT